VELQEIISRMEEIRLELDELEASPDATPETHGGALDRLAAEYDGLARERKSIERSEKMAAVRAAYADPGNREGPDQPVPGAPAYVPRTGERPETPEQVIQRAGDPWRDQGGPLHRETLAGLASRAHTAIEAQAERLGPGAELLARHLAETQSWGHGVSSTQTLDEINKSARLILAASSPHYETAFRAILRDPMAFTNGTGVLQWSDEERLAYADVGYAYRAAFAEGTGAAGGFLLPFVLDPTLIYTNAGTVSPWRRISRHATTTSNTLNLVTTAGATAQWLAEGAVAADATPTVGNLVLTPLKLAAWLFGSFELIGDTNISEQIPQVIAEARGRLEAIAFATGPGTTTPWGAVTRATVDGSTGLVSVANGVSVFSLHQGLPARFRAGDGAQPYWVANVAIIDALRGVAPFAAATTSIVNDQTADGIPELFGVDLLESSDMDAVNTTGGHKNLLFGDFSQYIICDRLGTTVVYEPLVKDSATARPTGQAGWFAYARVTADVTTATALRVHNNV
jgi:HK97 family phage major capsid protein